MATLYNSIMNKPQQLPNPDDIIRAPSNNMDTWIWQMPQPWYESVHPMPSPEAEKYVLDNLVEQIRARR